jgi:hypothetical protein
LIAEGTVYMEFKEFFSAYAESYETYRTEDVARFITSPCLFMLRGDIRLLASEVEVLEFLAAGLETYRSAGVAQFGAQLRTARMMGPFHCEADIDWEMKDDAGNVIMEFRTTYITAEQSGEWKIVGIIRHDET